MILLFGEVRKITPSNPAKNMNHPRWRHQMLTDSPIGHRLTVPAIWFTFQPDPWRTRQGLSDFPIYTMTPSPVELLKFFSLESATGCTHDTGLNEWAPHRIIRNSTRVHIWWHPVNNIDIYFYFYCNFNTVYLPHSLGLRPPENMLSPIRWVFFGFVYVFSSDTFVINCVF